jgi:LysR family cyn operon transcriptional activator
VAALDTISIRQLNKYPFVIFPYGIHTRMLIEQMFVRANVPVITPRIEVNDASLILKMVDTGRWLSILTKGVVARKSTLKAIPISGTNYKLCGCLVRPKDKYMSVLEKAFCEIIKKHWES